jgi:hypothetical protein
MSNSYVFYFDSNTKSHLINIIPINFINFQKVGFGHNQMCRVWFIHGFYYDKEKEASNNQK